jgi:hypothetical protein
MNRRKRPNQATYFPSRGKSAKHDTINGHSFPSETMKKSIVTPLAIIALSISAQGSKAEGGCPNGLYPAGGGYCRDIVCTQQYQTGSYQVGYGQQKPNGGVCTSQYCTGSITRSTGARNDVTAESTLTKFNQQCSSGATNWGNILVPKAR